MEVEHRHLERFDAATDEMRATFESPGGWPGLVGRFAEAFRG